jgi:hypothetical protein
VIVSLKRAEAAIGHRASISDRLADRSRKQWWSITARPPGIVGTDLVAKPFLTVTPAARLLTHAQSA